MITLRNFRPSDATVLQQQYASMTPDEIQAMISDWNRHEFQGRYFEMFAVVHDGAVVGAISLFRRTASVISIGPEIFPAFRRHGFGREAMLLALDEAGKKGYKIAAQQVLCSNAPSIALHESMGFETDRYVYTNRKGSEVFIFYKSLA